MAFSCSSITLHALFSVVNSFPGNGSSSFHRTDFVVAARRHGIQREESFLATCFSAGCIVCCTKKGDKLDLRSGLQTTGGQNLSVLKYSARDAEVDFSLKKESIDFESESSPKLDNGNGCGGLSGGKGKIPPGGGGDNNDHVNGDDEDDEFGPFIKFEEVIREAEARKAVLPSDMLEAAKNFGIQKVLLLRYLDMQASSWPLDIAVKSCSILRNRMLADPSFLFKIGTEIIIDSCCATFAEVQKRGTDFWAEFELYAADLLVGLVVNVALVGMLAPYARFGQSSPSEGFFGRITQAYKALPSSVFEAARPGCSYSVQQRIAAYFLKGILYCSVGFTCGIVGQGIANMIMAAKRSTTNSEDDIPIPPLIKSAVLWGVFLAVSSNTRYQVINGMERLVETSPVAKSFPYVALAFTVGIRFANNVYGGMQFVDWARWSGVQ